MLKMFTYRLYPTKKQEQKLNETLEECRWLYNHLLERRKTAYEQDGLSLTCFQQQYTFPALKQERPSLGGKSIPRSCKMWRFALIWPSKPSSDESKLGGHPATLASRAKIAMIAPPSPH